MSIPDSLTWQLIRNNNAFLVKRNGAYFSSEPGNVANLHSFKYSGLANSRSVGIVGQTTKESGVVLAKKSTKRSHLRKPTTTLNRLTLKRDYRRVARSIRNDLRAYRPDLRGAALARWFALFRSSKSSGKSKQALRKTKKATKKQ